MIWKLALPATIQNAKVDRIQASIASNCIGQTYSYRRRRSRSACNYADAISVAISVIAYGSRTEALAGFDATFPDLVILDVVLGEEVDAGFQLCRELLTRAPSLPVIFYRAN